MTNPTLERAERAVEDATFNELMPGQALIVARAVLMAVRSVDQDMQRAGMRNQDRNNVCATYTAMIDAILNDGEGE